jgi:hypothetical protein
MPQGIRKQILDDLRHSTLVRPGSWLMVRLTRKLKESCGSRSVKINAPAKAL